MANENPNDDITFDFFDDRLDIINSLNTFFSQHPDMIPRNVTLRINQYSTRDPLRLCSSIQGTGQIDSHYKDTVKTMATLCNAFLVSGAVIPDKQNNVSDELGRRDLSRDLPRHFLIAPGAGPTKVNPLLEVLQHVELNIPEDSYSSNSNSVPSTLTA